jgi:glycosyltransferase involved in cell wall biosynthesis
MTAAQTRSDGSGDGLRILHVLRAPLGGLFRHVLDLTREQIARGNKVGLIADSTTGGNRAAQTLAELEPELALGLLRLPIRRPPHVSDIVAAARINRHIRQLQPDVVHGHGSKGGLFARLSGLTSTSVLPIRAYTPHGGSFNHIAAPAIQNVYMAAERLLKHGTDIFFFESAFISRRFDARAGKTQALRRVIVNGVGTAEFVPVRCEPDAAEFVYVGELRSAKGVDTLIEAVARFGQRRGATPHLMLVGSGPDKEKLAALAESYGLGGRVSFPGPMTARAAFGKGQILVVPSRAESLPYVVLEAAAAQMPMVATDVGGIGEVFGPFRDRLIPCDDAELLADRLATILDLPPAARAQEAATLARFVATRFTLVGMADAVIDGYRAAIDRRRARRDTGGNSFAFSSEHGADNGRLLRP